MIVVDTSALMAIIMKEPEAQRCAAILGSEPELVISAGTVAEAMIVAGGRQVARDMERLITGAGLERSSCSGTYTQYSRQVPG